MEVPTYLFLLENGSRYNLKLSGFLQLFVISHVWKTYHKHVSVLKVAVSKIRIEGLDNVA